MELNYQEIVDKLNYELWELTEDISFYYMSATCIDYIGLHLDGNELMLWCSEEENFETSNELITHLRVATFNIVTELTNIFRVRGVE